MDGWWNKGEKGNRGKGKRERQQGLGGFEIIRSLLSPFPCSPIPRSYGDVPMSNEMTLEALRSVPLFASLTDDAATELRRLLTIKDVSAGAELFHKGDTGDAMYLIENGRVRISITDED